MNLVLGTHYKYDTYERFYYLTPVGAEYITGIQELDSEWKNVANRLKRQGRLLKYLMIWCTNDDNRPRMSRQDFIEYAQYTFDDQRKSVLFMLREMCEWAYDSDGDLIVYEERNSMDAINLLPITIRIEGSKSGLLDGSQPNYVIPQDEYQVGY